ncbi:phosphatidylinositol transfer protein PDR17 [Hordeum vulgare]|nr:phosphatidylinositol transfer protein PDR17 [Hordeum vulgare]
MFRRKQASHFNSDDSEQRQAKINELRATLGPMSARGEKYCSEACLARYLKARNWNVDKSRKMLEKCLKWRAVSRPEDIRWPNISVEAETRKMYTATFADREGRAVVIMRPAKQGAAPLRPSKRANREALEAAPSGIVSSLDLGRLISSRSGGSLRKVTAEAAAAGARVFADLHDALPDPLN